MREAFQLVVGFPVLPFLAQLVLLDVETLDAVEAVEFGGQVGPKLEKRGTIIATIRYLELKNIPAMHFRTHISRRQFGRS